MHIYIFTHTRGPVHGWGLAGLPAGGQSGLGWFGGGDAGGWLILPPHWGGGQSGAGLARRGANWG